MDVAYVLTLVQNPYALFMGWLYLGNTFCETAVYASLTLHHASKMVPGLRRCSLQLTHVQLYFTILHNAAFQVSDCPAVDPAISSI